MYFDSHCHLTDDRFAGEADAVVERARAAGVTRMVTIASDPDDADAALEIAMRHEGVWSTAGVHPHVAEQATADALARVRDLAGSRQVVAIGEAGLDYYYDTAPRDVQRAAFAAQLGLASELGLPIIVHAREADDDVAAMIREYAGHVTGVLHCFASGPALLAAGLEAGWYVSFSGLVTFRNYAGEELVRSVPEDRLLVETDSPYLAPVPHRGKRNEPAYVVRVVETVARMRGVDPRGMGERTAANARAFYGVE